MKRSELHQIVGCLFSNGNKNLALAITKGFDIKPGSIKRIGKFIVGETYDLSGDTFLLQGFPTRTSVILENITLQNTKNPSHMNITVRDFEVCIRSKKVIAKLYNQELDRELKEEDLDADGNKPEAGKPLEIRETRDRTVSETSHLSTNNF